MRRTTEPRPITDECYGCGKPFTYTPRPRKGGGMYITHYCSGECRRSALRGNRSSQPSVQEDYDQVDRLLAEIVARECEPAYLRRAQ